MFTQEQSLEIQNVLNRVPVALPPDRLESALQNTVNSLRTADRAQVENETIEQVKDAHAALNLLLNAIKILVEYAEAERQLTTEEQRLVNELDRLIGSLALRAAKIVRGLKSFEVFGKHDSFHPVH
jgi:hypothetical protein